MTEVKVTPFVEPQTKSGYLRKVETKLVEDSDHRFLWTGGPLESVESFVSLFRGLQVSAREEACVLFLDRDNNPIGYDLWLGGVDFCNIDPRRVLALTAQLLAQKIVILHNHPSGDPTPSETDMVFCLQMAQTCHILGWSLVDFVVFAPGGRHFSFRERRHPALTGMFVPLAHS